MMKLETINLNVEDDTMIEINFLMQADSPPPNKHPKKSLIELLFPEIFSTAGVQKQDLSLQILSQLRCHLQNLSNFHQLTQIQDDDLTLQRLDRGLSTSRLRLFNNYGAAIIMTKDKIFKPTELFLVFPSQWGFRSFVRPSPLSAQTSYIPVDPTCTNSIEIGVIDDGCDPLQIEATKYFQLVGTVINRQIKSKAYHNSKKNHHTPTWLLQCAKKALSILKSGEPQQTDKKDGKQEEEQEEKLLLSKGGTMDVGLHTGTTIPNTSAEVVRAILEFFTHDPQLVETLFLDLKIHLLQEVAACPHLDKNELRSYYKCSVWLGNYIKTINLTRFPSYIWQASKHLEIIYDGFKQQDKVYAVQPIGIRELWESVNPSRCQEDLLLQLSPTYDETSKSSPKLQGDLGFLGSVDCPSTCQELLKLKLDKGMLIILIEDFFFQLAIQVLDCQEIIIPIQLKEVECKQLNQFSAIHQLSRKYQVFIDSQQQVKKNGMMLKNQSWSHMMLIRYIAAAVVFQKVRHHRKDKASNLQEYKVLLKSQELYEHFYSLSHQARRAMIAIYRYQLRNKHKKTIFTLEDSNKSFRQFAEIIGQDDNTMRSWKLQKTRELKDNIDRLRDEFISFESRLKQLQANCSQIKLINCSCTSERVYNYRGRYHYQTKTCQRCYKLKSANQQLSQHENKQVKEILAPFPPHSQNLYAFLNNIPTDILGLIKIYYQAQTSSIITKDKLVETLKVGNYFQCQPYSPVVIFSSEVKVKNLQLLGIYMKEAESLVKYPQAETRNFYYNIGKRQELPLEGLSPEKLQKQQIQATYQFMIDSINNSKKERQHLIYVNKYQTKNIAAQQELIALGGIRVTLPTQLLLLTETIKNRTFLIETLLTKTQNPEDRGVVKKLVLLNAAADLNSLRRIVPGDIEVGYYAHAEEAIAELIQRYTDKWQFRDLYSLHLVGVIFSLFSKQISKEARIVSIAQVCFEEFQKFASENRTSNNSIKSQLAFFLHGTLSFYSEDLTHSLDKKAVHLWLKLVIMFRCYKVFSDQNIKEPKFRNIMLYYDHYRERALYSNIANVRQYFLQHPQQLTEIVRIVDNGIDDTTWSLDQTKGKYVFTGKHHTNSYEINLFSGIILKNGSELAGIPSVIKNNQTYISIFGVNRDLEVFPEPDGSLRTGCSFQDFFQTQGNVRVFFEFKVVDNDLLIRKIICRRGQPEQKYVLIRDKAIIKRSFILPDLYAKQYYAWYCKSRQIIVYRRKPLEKMNCIALIQIVKILNSTTEAELLSIQQSRIIQNNFRAEGLDFLTQKDNRYKFSHLRLFKKESQSSQKWSMTSLNRAFQILSSIQHPEYIIQAEIISKASEQEQCSEVSTQELVREEKIAKLWLHRYNLTFTLCSKNGLLSDNFLGYAVDESYRSNELVPFSKFDRINCLILKKIDQNLRFARNHGTMLLVPDNEVSVREKEGQLNPIAKGELIEMKMLSYEIHDHFKDIRGKRKLQQLHLACLVGSSRMQNFEPLMMTSTEYAMSILRSCVNIRPLSTAELKKLNNLLRIALAQGEPALILQCKAMFLASNILAEILPFDQTNKQPRTLQLFQINQDIIENCKYQYRQLRSKGNLPIRENLTDLELEILSFTHFPKKSPKQGLKEISPARLSNFQALSRQGRDELSRCQQINRKILNQSKINELSPTKQASFSISSTDSCRISTQQQEEIEESMSSYRISQHIAEQIAIDNENKDSFIKFYQIQLHALITLKSTLLSEIKVAQLECIEPIDLITRRATIAIERDFTSVLCDGNLISNYNPGISPSSAATIKEMIVLWLKLVVKIDSLERTLQTIRQSDKIDKIMLKRQLQSPREQIQPNLPWLCFEAEMKTQIWKTQHETYKLLATSAPGTFTQLNMGEGKTQVIIPMIVLNEIYNRKQFIPRVNILSPLYREAQDNYFKFLSVTGFRINIIALYFSRQVQVSQRNIYRMQYAIHLFKRCSLLMVDRDSSLSMILKIRQEYGFKGKLSADSAEKLLQEKSNKKDRWFFGNLPVLDIYDEVDALMTAKKSFVYAVGAATPLPSQLLRFEYSRTMIQIVVKELFEFLLDNQIAVIEQSTEDAKEAIVRGRFPKGMRFCTKLDHNQTRSFRKQIVDVFLSKDYLPPEFQFYTQLSPKQQEQLKLYLINEDVSAEKLHKMIPVKVLNQVFAVRGLIAYGIIQHCLSLRNGVDYGVPASDNKKRVGVPYEAADVPSKRSEYSHPDVSTTLSFLAYYSKGLTFAQFQEALRCLLNQNKSSQNRNYRGWLECIQRPEWRPAEVTQPKQINIESQTQKQMLYKAFKHCRSTISFWLICCVFPTDLTQYLKSITASSHDLASSKFSLGFTGTKDTRWTMPDYLNLRMSPSHQIKATDGKMITLMLENTLGVARIKTNSDELWKRFVENCLELNVGCIIDAGAVLAGKSLEKEIVPWLSQHCLFKRMNHRGILYCNESGCWKVYDVTTHATIDRDTSIPEHQTFVIFDEARTRGADIKMNTDMTAVLSLGPSMTKDKMMQAVGRLRKFGRNQKIYILGTEQVFHSVQSYQFTNETINNTRAIVEWVCQNSVRDNLKMLYPSTKLAWIHFENIFSAREVEAQEFDPNLSKMYKDIIEYERLELINRRIAQAFARKYQSNQEIINLVDKIDLYGHGYKVRCQSLEDICERQIEMVEESIKEVQRELLVIIPIKQNDEVAKYLGPYSTIPFKFHQRLSFSQNFIRCTQRKGVSFGGKDRLADNELCKVHFVRILPHSREMIVISQREAGLLEKKGVRMVGPYSLGTRLQDEFMARYSDITLGTPFVKQLNLEQALVDLQFFNGQENFQDKELIYETISRNLSIVPNLQIQKVVCHFLERRGTLEDLYYSSDLELVYKRLMNKL